MITATINPNPKNNKNVNKNQGGTPGVVELNAKQAQQHLHEQIIEQITKQKQQELLKQQQALIQLKVQEEVQKQLRNQAQKLQQQLQQPGQQQKQPSQLAQQPGQLKQTVQMASQQQKQALVQGQGQKQQQQQVNIQAQQKQAQSQKQTQSSISQQQQKANLNANQIQKPVTTQNRPQSNNNNPQNNASNANTSSPSKTNKKSGNPRVESPASKAKEQNNNVKINNKVLQPQLNNIITQAQQSVQAQQAAQNQQASQGKKSRARQEQLIEERVKAVNLAHARNSLNSAPPPAYNSHFGQPVQNSTVIQNGMGSPVKVQKQERPAPQGQAKSGDTTPRKQDPVRVKQEDSPPSDQGRNSGGKSKKMRKKNKGAEDINFIGE